MPLVLVNRDPMWVSDDCLLEATPKLAAIFVEVLGCEEATLNMDEIEVRVRDIRPPLDFNPSRLAIEVLANYYPSRAENIEERAASAAAKIVEQKLFDSDLFRLERAFVWIVLVHAGFSFL